MISVFKSIHVSLAAAALTLAAGSAFAFGANGPYGKIGGGNNGHHGDVGGGVIVTSGKVVTTTAGINLGYKARGHARMERRLPGETGITTVTLQVEGLIPGLTYGTHVHNGTCASGGGGHYQHVVGGDVNNINEIWLNLTADKSGKGVSKAEHAHLAREDARSIVIHESGLPTRIVCIDLK